MICFSGLTAVIIIAAIILIAVVGVVALLARLIQ